MSATSAHSLIACLRESAAPLHHALPGDPQRWPRDRSVDLRHLKLVVTLELEAKSVSGTATHTVVPYTDGLAEVARPGSMRPGSGYGVSGAISGPVVDLDLRTLYLKDLRLFGCTVLEPAVFGNLIAYIERGEIQPLVAATYKLTEIVAAQEAFLSKRHVGKIMLTV